MHQRLAGMGKAHAGNIPSAGSGTGRCVLGISAWASLSIHLGCLYAPYTLACKYLPAEEWDSFLRSVRRNADLNSIILVFFKLVFLFSSGGL